MSELIRYDVCDRVATVTLHRPDKRNALHHRLVAELKGALADAGGSWYSPAQEKSSPPDRS